jgi:hypothetical protein
MNASVLSISSRKCFVLAAYVLCALRAGMDFSVAHHRAVAVGQIGEQVIDLGHLRRRHIGPAHRCDGDGQRQHNRFEQRPDATRTCSARLRGSPPAVRLEVPMEHAADHFTPGEGVRKSPGPDGGS